MTTLLDYYNQNPELWEENKHLLAKDPAFDLGMMDLGGMNFEERRGGKPLTGFRKHLTHFTNLFTPEKHDRSLIEPITSPFGSFSPTTKDISIYNEPFSKDDVPTLWGTDEYRPIYNLDKAATIAHEKRHWLTDKYPELAETQPTWSTVDPEKTTSWIMKPSESDHWRKEAFNRFMIMRNFPSLKFKSKMSEKYPQGLSAVDLKPTDMYFDKIWKDHWEPHAKAYDEKLKEISKRQRKNVPGTPIVPMGGGDKGGGYQPTTRAQNVARTSSRVGPGGNVKAYGLAHGGLMGIPLPGRSRDI